MVDPKTRPFRQIAGIRAAQHMAHEIALSAADGARHVAGSRLKEAQGRLAAAENGWLAHLSQGGFIPEIAKAHLTHIRSSTAAEHDAASELRTRTEERGRAAKMLALASANSKAADQLAARERRALAIKAEERRLSELSDRVSRGFGGPE